MDEIDESIFFMNNARYTCAFAFFVVPLHREPALGMSAHQRRRVADIIKGVYWRLFWHLEIRKISSPKAGER